MIRISSKILLSSGGLFNVEHTSALIFFPLQECTLWHALGIFKSFIFFSKFKLTLICLIQIYKAAGHTIQQHGFANNFEQEIRGF